MHARTGWLLLLLSCTACDLLTAPPADGDPRWQSDDEFEPDCDARPCDDRCPNARAPGHCGNPLVDCLAAPAAPICDGSTDCGPKGTADCVEHRCVPRCDAVACAQRCTAAEGCRCELGECLPIPCVSDAACPEGRCVSGHCGVPERGSPATCSWIPPRLTVSRGGAAPVTLVVEADGGALLDTPAELSVTTRGGVAFRDGRVAGHGVGAGAVIATIGEVRCELPVDVVAAPSASETLLFLVDEQDGAPLQGALVRTAANSARTNAAGVARLPGVGLDAVEVTRLPGYERLVVGVPLTQQARLPLRRRAPHGRPAAVFAAGEFPVSGIPGLDEFRVAVTGFALAPTFDGVSPGALFGASRRTSWSDWNSERPVVRSNGVGANVLAPELNLLSPAARECPAQRCTSPTIWSVSFPALDWFGLRRPFPDLGPDWAFDLLRAGEGREVGLLLATPVPDPRGDPSPLPPALPASLQLHARVPPLDVGGAPRWGAFVGALAELPGRGLVVRGISAAIDPPRDEDVADGRLSDPAEVTCNGVPLRVGPRPAGATGSWRIFALSAETNPTRAACPFDRPCVEGLVFTRSAALHDGAVYSLGERFLRAPTADPPAHGVTTVKYCAEDPDAGLLVARWTEAGGGTTWLLPPGCGELELPGESGVWALEDAGDGAALTLQAIQLEGTPAELFDPDGPGLDHALHRARAITTTRVTAP